MSLLTTFKGLVQELLTSDYLHEDAREQIKKEMREEVQRIKREECGGNIEDPIYKRFNQGGSLVPQRFAKPLSRSKLVTGRMPGIIGTLIPAARARSTKRK